MIPPAPVIGLSLSTFCRTSVALILGGEGMTCVTVAAGPDPVCMTEIKIEINLSLSQIHILLADEIPTEINKVK